jgi:phosphoglycerol transferase MdoB-like AlkP superfamily enzyme
MQHRSSTAAALRRPARTTFAAMLLFYGGMMLWLGSIVFFGVGVASVVFQHLPSKDLAGNLNGIILQRLNVLEMVGAVLACSGVLLWNTTQAMALQRWKMLVPVAVVLLMAANLMVYAQYITPAMQTLKSHIRSFDAPAPSDAPLLSEFRSWHVVYSRLVGINIVLGLGAFVWQTWL